MREGDRDVPTEGPKSTVDLVMDRLQQQDADATGKAVILTDRQKEAIAAAKRDYAANVAEAEILFRSALMATVDPEVRQELEANHRRDLGQFVSARDKKIETARKVGESS
ncbi:MAG TPA: hypothetical protein DIU48_00740 [Acidobacteria bacterium]|nr:hypothetical protein [Acidobacteriota bacterium]